MLFVQLASYLGGGPLMWIMPVHLHVNQKSDYDDMMSILKNRSSNLRFYCMPLYNFNPFPAIYSNCPLLLLCTLVVHIAKIWTQIRLLP